MLELTYAMPCYNHAAFLIEALNSIRDDIATHHFSYEILIIDDGSPDNSLEVIKNWIKANEDINVRLIEQENHGIAKTVNKLYNNAKGKFVRLSASDDLIIPGSSVKMMALTNEHVDCVFGDGTVIDNDSNVIHESFVRYHGGDDSALRNNQNIPRKLINKWCIAGPCILVRRDFFNTYQYDENSRIDDFDFFLNLFKRPSSVVFLDDKVCAYRIHSTNTSKVKDVNVRILNLQSFLYLIDKYRVVDELKHIRADLSAKSYLTKCKISYLRGHYPVAVCHYAKYMYRHALTKLLNSERTK